MAVALKVEVNPSRHRPGDWRFASTGCGLFKARRAVWSFVAALALVSAASDAGAMGLGTAVVQSGLGQPLRMSFPVSVQRDEEVGCVQVRAKNDDLPGVANTRTAVIRNGFQTRIEIRSVQPVDEPAIGLVVSVGCASPISREYVIFLDPPVLAATTDAAATDGGRPNVPARADRAADSRRATANAGVSTPRAARPRKPSSTTSARPGRARTPSPAVSPYEASSAAPRATDRAPATATAPPLAKGDRLTIVPTEPPVAGASTPAGTPAPVAPAGAAAAVGSTPATPAAPDGGTPSLAAVPGAAATTAGDAEVAAREEAMRRQQAELQQQVKALSDQIAALKLQTATLANRNQALEQSGFSSTVVWLLVLLAALAVLVAGWMAWRYAQLRRSLDGAAWWTNANAPAATEGPPVAAETRSGLVALDPGTRLAPRTPESEVAPSGPARTSVSQVERPRAPPARPQRYQAQIDTDFTVSDIEAAMATVRTVSPPRDAPRPAMDDDDFPPLGSPTLPSPFAEPPSPAGTAKLTASEPSSSRSSAPALGDFVDIDIPPLPSPTGRAAATPSNGASSGKLMSPDDDALDFRLDIPPNFDPLATDSMKTTIIDGANVPSSGMAAPHMSDPLDFELPSATQIMVLSGGRTDPYAEPTRHGATALDDLFAAQNEPGIDTILNLDERDGSALSTTEVDRLTSSAIEGPDGEIIPLSTRALLARFADLMNQVDDLEGSDPLRAIALLRQYVLRDEKIPTLLWLRLFQLYEQVDKKPVYDALAEHFARRYDRPMVGWGESLVDRVPQTPLSAMGRIDQEIEALWGKEAGLERIRSLLCDRHLDDAIVFNAVLQRDLLDAAKVFPHSADSQIGGAGA